MPCAGRAPPRSLSLPVWARTRRTSSIGNVLAITPRLTWPLRRTPAGRPAGTRAIAVAHPRASASMAQPHLYVHGIGPKPHPATRSRPAAGGQSRMSLPRLDGHLRKVGPTSTGRNDGDEEAAPVHRRVRVRGGQAAGGERQHPAAGRRRARVHANQPRTWRNEQPAAGTAAAPARRKAEAAELVRPRRQVKGLEQEDDVPERAAATVACGTPARAAGRSWSGTGPPGR